MADDVDVELVWFPVYTDSLTALNVGKLDCNLQTWSDTMAPLAEGIPLKAVLLLDNSFGNDAMVAKPGIATPKDATRLAAEFPKIAQSFALLP